MTPAQEREKQEAEVSAKEIGGALAVILGLRHSTETVEWDAEKARFRVGTRFIKLSVIRRELRRIETHSGVKMARLADALGRNAITIGAWFSEMKRIIGSSHHLSAALATGSIAEAVTDPAVAARVTQERKYAGGFAKDIKKKKPATQRIKARANSYMLAAAVTFSLIEQSIRAVVGYTEAYRVTTARESCPGCREYAYRWIPIEAMPKIGSLECSSRCRCFLEYR